MRSSWIVIPKSDDKCPYKRHTEANHREQRTRPREDRDRDWSDWPPAKGCLQRPKMEEVRNGFSPIASGESPALPTSWFWTSGLQNHQRINFCCFEPLNLWSFVTVAIGNGYTQLQELSLRFSLHSPLLPFLSLSVLVRRQQKAFWCFYLWLPQSRPVQQLNIEIAVTEGMEYDVRMLTILNASSQC